MKGLIRRAVRQLGYDIVHHRAAPEGIVFPPDVSPADQAIVRRVSEFTMTSQERQLALISAVRYVVHRGIPGSFVECGVWRGGSMMAVALTLAELGETGRELRFYDTFEGMAPPTDEDKTADGVLARTHLERKKPGTRFEAYAGLDDVRANLASTQYPAERVQFIKGPVEQTIPAQAPPAPIALLRLDTDWYESTKHELEQLFPLLHPGGILIIDDYGHWQGARKAVDEYLAGQPAPYYLHRIDYTGRLLIK